MLNRMVLLRNFLGHLLNTQKEIQHTPMLSLEWNLVSTTDEK